MDIDQMEAGREMDLQVARAMEFSRVEGGSFPTYWKGDAQMPLPRLSADIAAAWEVDKPEWEWSFVEDFIGLRVMLFCEGGHPFDVNQPLGTALVK